MNTQKICKLMLGIQKIQGMLLVAMLVATPLFGYAQNKQGSSVGATQAKNQDQDRIQDPKDEPSQIQAQDQDRSQDLVGGLGGDQAQDQARQNVSEISDQDRIQDQDQLQTNNNQDTSTTTQQNPNEVRSGDIDPIKGLLLNPQYVRVRDSQELNEYIQDRTTITEKLYELENQTGTEQVYRNQNTLRIGAEAFVAAEDLIGGQTGARTSEIARQFEDSIQVTVRAEEQIRSRNVTHRFFYGTDEEAVSELNRELVQNRERIAELGRIVEGCDECGVQVKEVLQNQLQTMKNENQRLDSLANGFMSKGVFQYLFGWL